MYKTLCGFHPQRSQIFQFYPLALEITTPITPPVFIMHDLICILFPYWHPDRKIDDTHCKYVCADTKDNMQCAYFYIKLIFCKLMCAWEMALFDVPSLFCRVQKYICVISRNIIKNQYTKPQAKYYFV